MSVDPLALMRMDTFEESVQFQAYAYVKNSPYNAVDPDGLQAENTKDTRKQNDSKRSRTKLAYVQPGHNVKADMLRKSGFKVTFKWKDFNQELTNARKRNQEMDIAFAGHFYGGEMGIRNRKGTKLSKIFSMRRRYGGKVNKVYFLGCRVGKKTIHGARRYFGSSASIFATTGDVLYGKTRRGKTQFLNKNGKESEILSGIFTGPNGIINENNFEKVATEFHGTLQEAIRHGIIRKVLASGKNKMPKPPEPAPDDPLRDL